jgi:hypothetical protein
MIILDFLFFYLNYEVDKYKQFDIEDDYFFFDIETKEYQKL